MKYTLKRLDMKNPTARELSCRLLLRAFVPNHADDPSFHGDQFSAIFQNYACFGLFQHTIQIGFGVLREHPNKTVELMFPCLHPQYRGQDAGAFLIRGLIREALKLQAETVRIDVFDNKPSLKRRIMSFGFEPQTIVEAGDIHLCRMVLIPDQIYREYLNFCTELDRIPHLRYSFCTVQKRHYNGIYQTMLVLMQPYSATHRLSEQDYHRMLLRDNDKLQTAMRNITEFLESRAIPWIPITQQDDFSLTHAAALAGLGWIGKNNRLTTAAFGQKVLLAAILLGRHYPDNRSVQASRCGDCHACVDICPVSCLKNVTWTAQTSTEDLIDLSACEKYRSDRATGSGRPAECALCMWACDGNAKKRTF